MTTISMHAASAPAFAKMLSNMLAWLDAARAHADVLYVTDDNPRSEDPATIRARYWVHDGIEYLDAAHTMPRDE